MLITKLLISIILIFTVIKLNLYFIFKKQNSNWFLSKLISGWYYIDVIKCFNSLNIKEKLVNSKKIKKLKNAKFFWFRLDGFFFKPEKFFSFYVIIEVAIRLKKYIPFLPKYDYILSDLFKRFKKFFESKNSDNRYYDYFFYYFDRNNLKKKFYNFLSTIFNVIFKLKETEEKTFYTNKKFWKNFNEILNKVVFKIKSTHTYKIIYNVTSNNLNLITTVNKYFFEKNNRMINYSVFFLRKQKLFNKGRYSRNRQIYRTGVYMCIWLNIFMLYMLYFLFYGLTPNFSYLYIIFFIFIFLPILVKIFKYRLYSASILLNEVKLSFFWICNIIGFFSKNFFKRLLKTKSFRFYLSKMLINKEHSWWDTKDCKSIVFLKNAKENWTFGVSEYDIGRRNADYGFMAKTLDINYYSLERSYMNYIGPWYRDTIFSLFILRDSFRLWFDFFRHFNYFRSYINSLFLFNKNKIDLKNHFKRHWRLQRFFNTCRDLYFL